MQRSIESFFKKVAPAANTSDEQDSLTIKRKKRKAVVISSSDEEEEVANSKQKKELNGKAKKSRRDKVDTKDSSLHNPSKTQLKVVDPHILFGGETLRVEAKKPPKPKEKGIIELEDDEMDQSLMEVDIDENLSLMKNGKDHEKKEKTPMKEKKEKSPMKEKKEKTPMKEKKEKTPMKEKKEKTPMKDNRSERTPNKKDTPQKEKQEGAEEKKKTPRAKTEPKTERMKPAKLEAASPEKPKLDKDQMEAHVAEKIPKAKKPKKESREHSDLETSVLTDEERHERKRMAAMLYQKYKNRSAVINPGCKEVPKGKPNCLAGLNFLVTGVLESIERDEANSIIKELGGKVMTVVGKRLNYLIVGEDAGPKKLAQAEDYGITILSEDGLFDLIREKSGEAPQGAAKVKEEESKIEKKPSLKTPKKEGPKMQKEEKEVKIKAEKTKSPKGAKDKSREECSDNHIKIKKEKVEEKPMQPIKREVEVLDANMQAWVDKYKPQTVKDIVGQQGAASNVVKLTNWLSKWYSNHDGKKKLQKPNPWAKNDDGSYYKAALLSGPPGVGKTTTANLVSKELGFDIVEFNASDTRSKRLLKEEVSELLSNKSLYGYFHGNTQAVSKKHVLIMDEVDGMAGNEDRGGIQELIQLIKESSVPIICMCNDRNHQKMRSLVNYCYDLRFNKPRVEQIKGRIMGILFKEDIKMEPAKVEEIILATNNDIRQSINHISLLSAGKELQLKANEKAGGDRTAQKDLKLGPWEVVRKVFSADEHKHMSMQDKSDLFFHDYSLAPLFVQQNYLQVSPIGPKTEILKKMALTADSLSLGDLVDKAIRSSNAWSLLPTMAVFSSVMPGEYMCGHFTGQINFPGWLGKNSRATKRSRLAQEIHDHTRVRTSGSRLSVRLEYAPFWIQCITRPLREHGMEGVEEALNVLKEYHLLREDIDSLVELASWPGKKNPLDLVDGRVKAALTRAYNKEVMPYTYSVQAGVKKKKAEASDDMAELMNGMEGEEGEGRTVVESEEEEDDNLENDNLIKAKKKSEKATSKASTSAKAASAGAKKSAGGGASRGKAKK